MPKNTHPTRILTIDDRLKVVRVLRQEVYENWDKTVQHFCDHRFKTFFSYLSSFLSMSAPGTPLRNTNRRRANTRDSGGRSISPPAALRSRLNSKDIPRTYAGLYGTGGELTHQTPNSDLLPFELSRNLNTNWLLSSSESPSKRKRLRSGSLLWSYIFFIAFIQFTVMVLPLGFISMESSFTYTNIIHTLITLLFLHWIKGSPNFYEQGELNAMTLWEQLSSSPDTEQSNNTKKVLVVTPTVLCYLACHFSNYDKLLSVVNLVAWAVCVIAKLENMNGVRLMGINRTIGIDDDLRKCE